MTAFVRSLLYALVFYSMTGIWVLAGLAATLIGRKPTLAVVLSWVELHHWLVEHVLGIHVRVEGRIPAGPHLVAVKHQSMLETLEMVRLMNLPVIVIKKELADIPFFGWMTRRYGVIAVERSAGARALRALVEEGKQALNNGRPVIIYPEGTRVRVGETPRLRSGFAALYRALALPVVPVAVDSGRLWGRGFVHRPGIATLRVGKMVPPGLKRDEVEALVHGEINALELSSEPCT
ncbi:MAG TPA: lysophospholipid acyltransferase family protein [Sphingomicrobium sp.]|nr:lysophospholipid acyltransferase family protein [Sphingomicrobium sp.]